jgi:drug/metabolite transporter (DMT)-like permease
MNLDLFIFCLSIASPCIALLIVAAVNRLSAIEYRQRYTHRSFILTTVGYSFISSGAVLMWLLTNNDETLSFWQAIGYVAYVGLSTGAASYTMWFVFAITEGSMHISLLEAVHYSEIRQQRVRLEDLHTLYNNYRSPYPTIIIHRTNY